MSEISVTGSKLIYYQSMFNEKEIIVEMKVGKKYAVKTYAGDTGDTVCEFESELESIIIDDVWKNEEDYPDGFIVKLTFKNGVIINDPQYNHDAVNICEIEMK